MVLLSGDIVDKGATSFKQRETCYKTFCDYIINPITSELSIPKNRFFFVPGNHDIWRDKDSEITERGLSQILINTEEVNKYIDSNSEEGVKRIEPFNSFEHQFYGSSDNIIITKYHSLFKFQIDSFEVGVACLNSAWRSFDTSTDRHNLIIGERQVSTAREYLDSCSIKIALVHHPLEWLTDFDRRCVEPLIENTFHLLFCGHVHSGSSWVKTDMYKGIFISVAPANWKYGIRSTEGYCYNGYSIVDFNPETSAIKVGHRRYSYNKNKYVPDSDFGNDFGISHYMLPSSKEHQQRHYENSLISTIRNSHFSEMNEHLLTYNTDTKAPQDVQSLFVFPRIVEKINFKSESKEKEEPFSLDDICLYKSNQIIFGVKEAGKTILIDDLLIHFTENLSKYLHIPVYIDFRKITTIKRLETLIARYLGISPTSIDNLLTNHKIILLIDNLGFGEHDKNALGLIEKFLKNAKHARMIGSLLQVTEGAIPVELYDYPYFSSFRHLHIKAFASSETRQLIKKWFSTHPSKDIEGKVEKLLDTLLKLNIPRTPLAISMFLWIIEQQETYEPINNATMLENFIEKLFSKHAKKEIYADRFDFKNKVRLLSDIAHRMLTDNRIDYNIPSRALDDFIDDILKAKKFDFIQSKDVLEHFIEKGILVEEHDGLITYIRFRFSCFMHYFLMRKMDFDSDFKSYVLKPNTFLMYTEEIELYTGTKRDQTEILNSVIKRMENEFRKIVEIISSLPDTYDEIFKSNKSLTATIDETFLTSLRETEKPSQAEIDAMRDKALEKIQPEKGIQKKDTNLSKKKKMELLWTLAAKVLRNTEETTVTDLKYNSYVSILKCSMAHAFLWKVHIDYFIEENINRTDIKIDEELKIQREVLPLIHELWIRMLLGTNKLSVVFKEKMEADKKNSAISDFERFISVFLYADIRGKDQNKWIKAFIKKVRNPHLVDMTLFKLISYYFLRSKTKYSDKQYENMIGDLIVNAQGLKKSKKGVIIQNYRDRRQFELKRGKNQSKKQERKKH